MLRNTQSNWGSVSKCFHWGIALLIFFAMAIGILAEEWPLSPLKLNLFVWHKTIGITVLILATLRVFWKLANPTPSAPADLSKTNATLANLGHYFLYFLLFAMPISGWILNSAANFPFKLYGIFTFPSITGPSEVLQEQAELVHFVLFLVLLATAVGHGTMAIAHHVKHGNTILTRMLPTQFTPFKFLAINIIVLGLAVATPLFLTNPKSSTAAPSESAELASSDQSILNSEAVAPAKREISAANPQTLWQILYEQSELGFTGLYYGAEFNGVFEKFSAEINFDPAKPEAGHFDVLIDTTSVNTFSSERDDAIGDADWFHFSKHPTSTYRTKTITELEDGSYVALGELNLKGVKKEIALKFTWTQNQDGQTEVKGEARMLGKADIKRTDFRIGDGMWSEDDSIGMEIVVKVNLLLTPSQTNSEL